MNQVIEIGRVYSNPVYFPAQGTRSDAVFFMLRVATRITKDVVYTDFFSVRYAGPNVQNVAKRIKRSKIVCVKGHIHLDASRQMMRIDADWEGGVEVYTNLPPLLGGYDPSTGDYTPEVQHRFMRSVEACHPGDYLILSTPIRVVRGKHPYVPEEESPREEENAPLSTAWIQSMEQILAGTNPFDTSQAPILPDMDAYAAHLEQLQARTSEGLDGLYSSDTDDCSPEAEEEQEEDIEEKSVPLPSASRQRLTCSNPFPAPACAKHADLVQDAVKILDKKAPSTANAENKEDRKEN